jgi:uncharacterized protein (DUF1800 family)
MYRTLKTVIFAVCVVCFSLILFSFLNPTLQEKNTTYRFPYKKAGLTKEQAAEHLLNRFSFGIKGNDIAQLVNMGLENWFEKQLAANEADPEVQERLMGYDALNMTNEQIIKNFPDLNEIRKMAIDEGVISKEDLKDGDKKDYRKMLNEYQQKNNLRDQKELFRQFINQKIILATYSNNQLKEVLTDFWFNHFNVSVTKNNCARYIPVFERDAIRPNITGNFENLVLATAKSPAMLLYLDNFVSMGQNETLMNKMQQRLPNDKIRKRPQGLNENYAREVMELHTLGVDGGYTQKDVTEAARVLTGWTIFPISDKGPFAGIRKIIDKIGEDRLTNNGFVHEGDFLFANNRHDDSIKTVLGKTYSGGGYLEGMELLKTLANHSSTAKFISKKLAVRFVSDNPPQSLIDKMAKTFLETRGNIKAVLIAMVTDDAFWSKAALREKTKSPFEYAISSLRALHADITMPFQINNWITKMGQKMYFYQAPTGFPDKGTYWINTGALLNRMNFGLALAGKRIPGVKFDLAALNNHHEPESAQDALIKYAKILMPERNLEATIKRLTPLVNDPLVGNRIAAAADKNKVVADSNEMPDMANNNEMEMTEKPRGKLLKRNDAVTLGFGDNSMLAQVVGIIIGSPEFQRR